MLVTAIVQLGVVYNRHLTLTDAVRAGARVAAVSRKAADPVQTTDDAVVAAAAGLDPATVRSGLTVDSTWLPGADVTVRASYPYRIDIFGITVETGSLTSVMTERVE